MGSAEAEAATTGAGAAAGVGVGIGAGAISVAMAETTFAVEAAGACAAPTEVGAGSRVWPSCHPIMATSPAAKAAPANTTTLRERGEASCETA